MLPLVELVDPELPPRGTDSPLVVDVEKLVEPPLLLKATVLELLSLPEPPSDPFEAQAPATMPSATAHVPPRAHTKRVDFISSSVPRGRARQVAIAKRLSGYLRPGGRRWPCDDAGALTPFRMTMRLPAALPCAYASFFRFPA